MQLYAKVKMQYRNALYAAALELGRGMETPQTYHSGGMDGAAVHHFLRRRSPLPAQNHSFTHSLSNQQADIANETQPIRAVLRPFRISRASETEFSEIVP